MQDRIFKQANVACELEGEEEDDRFGRIKVHRNKQDGGIVFSKERLSCELSDCQKDLFQVRERMKMNQPALLRLIDYSAEEGKVENERAYIVTAYYDFPNGDLGYEIDQRRKKENHFSSRELSSLLSDMCEAASYLQKNKMVHGDIRPKYFSRFEKENKYKMLDRLGTPAPAWQVQQTHFNSDADLYMSPAYFSNLSMANHRFRHDPYKSDSFSIGLVILEAGLLHSIQSIYSRNERKIDAQELQALLQGFDSVYGSESPSLCEALRKLLAIEEGNRMDPIEFYEYFQSTKGVVVKPSSTQLAGVVPPGQGTTPIEATYTDLRANPSTRQTPSLSSRIVKVNESSYQQSQVSVPQETTQPAQTSIPQQSNSFSSPPPPITYASFINTSENNVTNNSANSASRPNLNESTTSVRQISSQPQPKPQQTTISTTQPPRQQQVEQPASNYSSTTTYARSYAVVSQSREVPQSRSMTPGPVISSTPSAYPLIQTITNPPEQSMLPRMQSVPPTLRSASMDASQHSGFKPGSIIKPIIITADDSYRVPQGAVSSHQSETVKISSVVGNYKSNPVPVSTTNYSSVPHTTHVPVQNYSSVPSIVNIASTATVRANPPPTIISPLPPSATITRPLGPTIMQGGVIKTAQPPLISQPPTTIASAPQITITSTRYTPQAQALPPAHTSTVTRIISHSPAPQRQSQISMISHNPEQQPVYVPDRTTHSSIDGDRRARSSNHSSQGRFAMTVYNPEIGKTVTATTTVFRDDVNAQSSIGTSQVRDYSPALQNQSSTDRFQEIDSFARAALYNSGSKYRPLVPPTLINTTIEDGDQTLVHIPEVLAFGGPLNSVIESSSRGTTPNKIVAQPSTLQGQTLSNVITTGSANYVSNPPQRTTPSSRQPDKNPLMMHYQQAPTSQLSQPSQPAQQPYQPQSTSTQSSQISGSLRFNSQPQLQQSSQQSMSTQQPPGQGSSQKPPSGKQNILLQTFNPKPSPEKPTIAALNKQIPMPSDGLQNQTSATLASQPQPQQSADPNPRRPPSSHSANRPSPLSKTPFSLQ